MAIKLSINPRERPDTAYARKHGSPYADYREWLYSLRDEIGEYEWWIDDPTKPLGLTATFSYPTRKTALQRTWKNSDTQLQTLTGDLIEALYLAGVIPSRDVFAVISTRKVWGSPGIRVTIENLEDSQIEEFYSVFP